MSIFIVDEFLNIRELEKYKTLVNQKQSQKVIEDSKLAEEFWELYGDEIRKLDSNCIGIFPSVTITNSTKPIQRHTDVNRHGERYKILIYLNSVPNGGTLFYANDTVKLIENRENRLVMFDMRISHESQDFQKLPAKLAAEQGESIKKLAIGFRVQVQ
jgi:hypothetical protein